MKKTTAIFLLLNIVAFSVIGFLFFYIHQKEQTPSAVLAPHITMGMLTLNVGNFFEMEHFYTKYLGMQILSKTNNSATLGYGQQGVLQFVDTPQLPQASASDPGLDQLAIVFTTRGGLARALQRIMKDNASIYLGGTSRGAVGEAFYVNDPAGNTLELYYDTDPSTWPRSSRGNVEGNALPIDITSYIQNYANKNGDNSMRVGHLQMRIGDIIEGKKFYVDTVGFYVVPQLPDGTSLSLSDGFYHHNLVLNQVQGYDGDPVSHYQGLQGFEVDVPNAGYIDSLKKRLTAAGVKFVQNNKALFFTDPWGITVTIKSLNVPFWQSLF